MRRQEACRSEDGGVGRGRGEARIKPTNQRSGVPSTRD